MKNLINILLGLLLINSVNAQTTDNWSREYSANVQIFTESQMRANAIDPNLVLESTSYMDDKGNHVQTVMRSASPEGNDIVQDFSYNSKNQLIRSYLPYESTEKNGSRKVQSLQSQQLFYTDIVTGIERSGRAFREFKYSSDFQSYVNESSRPGKTWAMGGQHTNKVDLDYNQFPIDRWGYNSSGVNKIPYQYQKGDLHVSETIDEEGRTKLIFSSFDGIVVCTASETSIVTSNATSYDGKSYEFTYNVYDLLGNLRFIVPQAAVSKAGSAGLISMNSDIYNSFIYEYVYDNEKRIIEFKEPHKAIIRVVYNKKGLPVLTQTGNQSVTNQWTYTKYDPSQRIVSTGLYEANGISLASIRATAFQMGVQAERENTNAATGYYTNLSFPNTNNTALTYYYYDNYDINNDNVISATDPAYVNSSSVGGSLISYLPANDAVRLQGKLVHKKVKVLTTGPDKWIYYDYFYDDEDRVTQIVKDNEYLDKRDIYYQEYNYNGTTSKTLREHFITRTGSDFVFTYNIFQSDHVGRPLSHDQMIGNENSTTTDLAANLTRLSENTYNELGTLIETNIEVNDGVPLQSVDFCYTINGWLKQVNNPDLEENCGTGYVSFNKLSSEMSALKIALSNEIVVREYMVTVGVSPETVVEIMGDGQIAELIYLDLSQQDAILINSLTWIDDLGITQSYQVDQAVLDAISALDFSNCLDLEPGSENEPLTEAQVLQLLECVSEDLPPAALSALNNKLRDFLSSNCVSCADDDDDDLFGFRLTYDKTEVPGAQAKYDGSVSGIVWKNKLPDGMNTSHPLAKKQAFSFDYDLENQLLFSKYATELTAGSTKYWETSNQTYNSEYTYSDDGLGDMKTLKRNGFDGTSTVNIDDLVYQYNSTDNMLDNIEENSALAHSDMGFVSTTGPGAQKYRNLGGYDLNGNLLGDLNKSTLYTYNHLNLVSEATTAVGVYTFIYDAEGNKLEEQVPTPTGVNIKKYVDGFHYTNTTAVRPDKIAIGSGFATSDGTSIGNYTYTYSLSDHRGNKRVVFTNDGNNEAEVLQIKTYYPFGLEIESLKFESLANQTEGFNGKEYKEELTAYDFGARLYDPSVARWFNADPMSSAAPNWSSFRFGYNSPLNFSDPTGMLEVGGALQYNTPNSLGGRFAGLSFGAAYDAAFYGPMGGSESMGLTMAGDLVPIGGSSLTSLQGGVARHSRNSSLGVADATTRSDIAWMNDFMENKTPEQLQAFKEYGTYKDWKISSGSASWTGSAVFVGGELVSSINNGVYFDKVGNQEQMNGRISEYLGNLELVSGEIGAYGEARVKYGNYTKTNGQRGNFYDRPYKRLSKAAKSSHKVANNLSKIARLSQIVTVVIVASDYVDDGNIKTSTVINTTLTVAATVFPVLAPFAVGYAAADIVFGISERIDQSYGGIDISRPWIE